MVHDPGGGGDDDLPEQTRGEEPSNPGLHLVVAKVVPRGDDSALVEPSVEGDDNLPGPVVVNEDELVDVAVLEHDLQELDDDLGGRAGAACYSNQRKS